MPVIEPVNQQVINTVLSVEEKIPIEYQYSENERELYGSFLRIAAYISRVQSLYEEKDYLPPPTLEAHLVNGIVAKCSILIPGYVFDQYL